MSGSGWSTEITQLAPVGGQLPPGTVEQAVRLFAIRIDGGPQPAVHFALVERWPHAEFDVAVWPDAPGRAEISLSGRAVDPDRVTDAADRVLARYGWIRSQVEWVQVGCESFRADVVRITSALPRAR